MNKAFVVVDLSFGDSGKGTTVDFLTRKFNSDLTVRFSGGPQAAHHVVDDKGNHHMFNQFGAGSLAGARTLITRNMLVNPLTFLEEEKRLSKLIPDPFKNVYVDENCVIITPYHRFINKFLEEQRRENKHGTCGHGVWEALKDSIKNPARCLRIYDLFDQNHFENKLRIIKQCYENIYGSIDIEIDLNKYQEFRGKIKIPDARGVRDLINNSKFPVFEGNQGILLDDDHGFYPYITANSTTSKNALKLLEECNWKGETEVIGVTRAFATRHGPGPFPTENKELSNILCDVNNPTNRWQGNFRHGWLDFVMLNYAIECDGNINSLSVTHVDQLEKLDNWKISYNYDRFRFGLNKMISNDYCGSTSLYVRNIRTTDLMNSVPEYTLHSKKVILNLIENYTLKWIKIKSFGPRSDQKEWIE